jgi:hypothetical protein
MAHGKSLRLIGQSLEAARLAAFELKMDGAEYVVTSNSLSTSGEWILRHALSPNDLTDQGSGPASAVTRSVSFNSAALSRLDDQARKQRRNDSTPNAQAYSRLSQLLRALGDHLDRTDVRAFHISWTPQSVCVDSQLPDGERDSRMFTSEKLEQLGSHARFRRSSGSRLDSKTSTPVHRTK